MAKRGRGGGGAPEAGGKSKKKRQTQQNGSESQQPSRDASSSPAHAPTAAEGAACKKLPKRTDRADGAEKEDERQAKGHGEKGITGGGKKSEKEDNGGGRGASCNNSGSKRKKKAHEEEGYEGPVAEEDSDGSDASSEGMAVQAFKHGCARLASVCCAYVPPVTCREQTAVEHRYRIRDVSSVMYCTRSMGMAIIDVGSMGTARSTQCYMCWLSRACCTKDI